MRLRMVGLLGGLLVAVAGCSTGNNPTNLVPVKGKVVSGGKTLGWVDVRMYPTEPSGTMTYGFAGADGVITFKSLNDQDGAKPGKYKVTVKGWQTKGASPPPLPSKYAEETSTDLTAVIPSGGGEITITLP